MKVLSLTVAGLGAALVLAVGLNSALASNRSPSPGSKVAVASSTLGRILVDGSGRTLYLFGKDKHGKSACAGPCASAWPPLIAAKPVATAGAKASLLGTTRRADGRLQVTYNHHPLYRFFKDVKKGQTNGEELVAFGAEWYALSPAGARVEKSPARSSSSGDPAPGGYGYGY